MINVGVSSPPPLEKQCLIFIETRSKNTLKLELQFYTTQMNVASSTLPLDGERNRGVGGTGTYWRQIGQDILATDVLATYFPTYLIGDSLTRRIGDTYCHSLTQENQQGKFVRSNMHPNPILTPAKCVKQAFFIILPLLHLQLLLPSSSRVRHVEMK